MTLPDRCVVREGDPRYNLLQDIIEGDIRTQGAAIRKLDAMTTYMPRPGDIGLTVITGWGLWIVGGPLK